MAKELNGVKNVIGGLLSSSGGKEPPEDPPPAVESAAAKQSARPAKRERAAETRTSARRGRPPGRSDGVGKHKEKNGWRLSTALVEAYTDWSWRARKNPGELAEEALIEGLKRKGGESYQMYLDLKKQQEDEG